jgi:hypothetical protein
MTTEYKRIPTEAIEYWDARKLTDSKQARTVEDAQRIHREKQLADMGATAALAKIKGEQESLSQRQADLDAKRNEHLALIALWESKLTTLENAQRRLKIGIDQFQSLDGLIDGRLEWIHQNCWGCNFGENSLVGNIVGHYSQTAGLKLLMEDFPKWRSAREAEVAALEADLKAFAALHKIQPGK